MQSSDMEATRLTPEVPVSLPPMEVTVTKVPWPRQTSCLPYFTKGVKPGSRRWRDNGDTEEQSSEDQPQRWGGRGETHAHRSQQHPQNRTRAHPAQAPHPGIPGASEAGLQRTATVTTGGVGRRETPARASRVPC